MKELGIYVHIPFCKQKCYYCDFLSFQNKEDLINQYIKSIIKEIKNTEISNEYNITTVYIGGGTPSYIDSSNIIKIIKTLKEKIKIEDAEITLEINPGTITKEKLKQYYDIGINRISIGLQTTDDILLKQIGRIHSFNQFLEGYKLIRQVGFKNVNIDLMIGLPNQTVNCVKKSVKEVLTLNPEHISIYSLIVEENTKIEEQLKQKLCVLPTDEIERKQYWYVKNVLEENGYKHYEISNYAKTNYESKHNLNCWEQKEYFGFGIGAHSYINKKRYSNIEDINKYINNAYTKIIYEVQTKESEMKEYMMLGLRKIEGIKISDFKNKFMQNPVYVYKNELNKLVEQKLIEIYKNSIKLSNKGIDFANIVWKEFV